MKKSVIFFGLIILLTASTLNAFDSERKGFVVGGGLGLAPMVKWKIDNGNAEDTKIGNSFNAFIGNGFSNSNLLVFEFNGAFFSSDYFLTENQHSLFFGPVWYHFWNDEMFTLIGAGRMSLKGNWKVTSPGWGMMIGTGYEIYKHFILTGYLAAGRTDPYGHDADWSTSLHFGINLSVMGY